MRTALLLLSACGGAPKVAATPTWQVINAETRAATEDGKQVVTLAPVGGNRKGSNVGMALATGVTLTEGAIDVDLRGLGETTASFVGIAFAVADPNLYEAIYFRPFRFRGGTDVDRSHAVQYIAWPERGWEALRAQSPGVYETAIAPVPDPAGWFHAHIEVNHTTVKVFVDGAAEPTLVVTRLRNTSGGVGLWVDSQAGSFAGLKIADQNQVVAPSMIIK